MAITRNAYAKINLGLDVIGLDEKRYHLVRMIMQNISLHDVLTFEKTSDGQITLELDENSSPMAFGNVPLDEHNLIWKVCNLLRHKYGISQGVHILLEKNIPAAAGMAGGSTDAAAAFLGMNELFDLGISTQELCEMATPLGADIPYCIVGGTALAEGIGEVLTVLPDMPDCHIVVAKPPIGVSTKWVYTELDSHEIMEHPDIDGIQKAIADRSLCGIVEHMGNVLEPVTAVAHPEIGTLEKIMKDHGALRSMMSGSGPTVFGIFDDEATAQSCYEDIAESGLAPECYLTHPIHP